MNSCCSLCNSFVVDTRPLGTKIKRRRECKDCKTRFTTYESIPGTDDIKIMKCKCGQYPTHESCVLEEVIRCGNCNLMMTEPKKLETENNQIFLQLVNRWNKIMS